MKNKKGIIVISVTLWIIIVSISLVWNMVLVDVNTKKIIFGQAQSFFNEIITTRLWNASHGGVYVPTTSKTQPNAYLVDPNRDIITTDSIRLTKVNPAFMTRMIAEIAKTRSDIQYHITSLKPLRPLNSPDEWEKKALKKFEQGHKEIFEHINNKSQNVFRYMAPLAVDNVCLKCHAIQGYKEGDIRGGISVTIKGESITDASYNQKFNLILIHIFAYMAGIFVTLLINRIILNNIAIMQTKNKVLIKEINTRIKTENELRIKSKELELANKSIYFKNENLNSSIRYAKSIQHSILPTIKHLNNFFETFVLYRPKDIVSGDFYWYTCVNKNNKNYYFYILVDCTGHGVPGAFMSIIGARLLNGIINQKKEINPCTILELLDDRLIKALKQNESDNNDGMELSICRIETKDTENSESNYENKITYSGAKLPLYYYNSNNNEVIRIKGTRRPAGGTHPNWKTNKFENHELYLNKGDMVYFSSDGFMDQNSPDRKRFGRTHFIETLLLIAQKPFETQQNELNKILEDFMQGENQRDDISLMGIKI